MVNDGINPRRDSEPLAPDENVQAAVGEAKQCQIDLAVADVGAEGVEQLVGEWIEESLQTQIDPSEDIAGAVVDWAKPERPIDEFFAAKGYVC